MGCSLRAVVSEAQLELFAWLACCESAYVHVLTCSMDLLQAGAGAGAGTTAGGASRGATAGLSCVYTNNIPTLMTA